MEKISNDYRENVRVLDGFADALAFPDDTFDVVMSGHVVGDDYEREIAELSRVCKPALLADTEAGKRGGSHRNAGLSGSVYYLFRIQRHL